MITLVALLPQLNNYLNGPIRFEYSSAINILADNNKIFY